MRKLICKDSTCKYHGPNDVCQKKTVEINFAKCLSFEKGFYHYVLLPLRKLQGTNMILPSDLNEDMKIGLFYIMEIYNLKLVQFERADWRWLMLVEEGSKKGLKAEEITARPINEEKLVKHMTDCANGILPNQGKEEEKPKKTSQPFGWLSPTGDFTEGDFGEHEAVAFDIITKKGFREEYRKKYGYDMTARDFLSEVKGYVLIHNPAGYGGYIVSNVKPMTKKQKEFLYGYFMDLGDKWKAEQYLDD